MYMKGQMPDVRVRKSEKSFEFGMNRNKPDGRCRIWTDLIG